MIKESSFYSLQPLGDSCEIVDYEIADARKSWLCPGCAAVRVPTQVDVRLSEEPSDQPLNFASPSCLGIISREFIDALGEEVVRSHLYIGRVAFRGTPQSPDWFTFRGKSTIIVRQTEHAGYRICGVCGRCVYFGMGLSYLYPTPARGIEIFDAGGWLVLTKRLFSRVAERTWRNLDVVELGIVDTPRDGFGILRPA